MKIQEEKKKNLNDLNIKFHRCARSVQFFLLHSHLSHTGISLRGNRILFAAHFVHATLASHFRSKSIRPRSVHFFFSLFSFFSLHPRPVLYRGFSLESSREQARRGKCQFLLRIPVALGVSILNHVDQDTPDRAFS